MSKPNRRVVGRYSGRLGEAICARIAKGESLASVCRDTDMPPRSTVDQWRKRYPSFKAGYDAALAKAGGPARGGRRCAYSLKTAVELCRRIGEGEALHRICREQGMPSQGAVYLWLKKFPEFEAMYVQAREIQAFRLFDEVREIAEAATPETLQLAKLRISVIQWQAGKLSLKGVGEKAERETRRGREQGEATPFQIEVVNFGDEAQDSE